MAQQTALSVADLAHVGKGTPAGEWLRRYWLVVSTDADLRDVPRAIRILGEDLVLFRDGQGRPGLLGIACPHRGTSLEYGELEDAGIRCPYHGWLFDVGGRCLEQPAEPRGSTSHERVRQLSYPVREQGGLLFAYLGGDEPPPLPRYAPLLEPAGQRQIEPVRYLDYNWFNFWENSADPYHICVLHRFSGYGDQTFGNQFFSYHDMPRFQPVEHEHGFKIVMRKPGPRPGTVFEDVMNLAFPSIIQIGDTEFVHLKMEDTSALEGGTNNTHILFLTPNDDEHFMVFTVDHYTGPEADFHAKLKAIRAHEVPREPRKPYDSRPLAPFRGSIRDEDVVAQGTQAPLGARREHLVTSDKGVIAFRRTVLRAIEAVQRGERPKGVLAPGQADELIRFDSFVGVRPE